MGYVMEAIAVHPRQYLEFYNFKLGWLYPTMGPKATESYKVKHILHTKTVFPVIVTYNYI